MAFDLRLMRFMGVLLGGTCPSHSVARLSGSIYQVDKVCQVACCRPGCYSVYLPFSGNIHLIADSEIDGGHDSAGDKIRLSNNNNTVG